MEKNIVGSPYLYPPYFHPGHFPGVLESRLHDPSAFLLSLRRRDRRWTCASLSRRGVGVVAEQKQYRAQRPNDE